MNPYCFSPVVTNESIRDFNSGADDARFTKVIPVTHDGIKGVSFVWAPSAKSVHLVGDFVLESIIVTMRSLGVRCREIFVPFAQVE